MCNLARTCQTLHRNHYLFKLLMKLTCWRFLLYQGFGQRQRAPSSRWRCQACNLQTYPKTILSYDVWTILSYEWRLLGLEAMRDLKISYHRLDSNPSLAPKGFNAKLSLPNCKGRIICTIFSTSKKRIHAWKWIFYYMMTVMLWCILTY